MHLAEGKKAYEESAKATQPARRTTTGKGTGMGNTQTPTQAVAVVAPRGGKDAYKSGYVYVRPYGNPRRASSAKAKVGGILRECGSLKEVKATTRPKDANRQDQVGIASSTMLEGSANPSVPVHVVKTKGAIHRAKAQSAPRPSIRTFLPQPTPSNTPRWLRNYRYHPR